MDTAIWIIASLWFVGMNILLELFMTRPGSDIAIYINSEKSGIRAICDEKGPPKLRLKEVKM